MEFAAHFKYDREITLWLSEFMGRALPGTCFPEEVPYCLCDGDDLLDSETHRLFMTLDVDGGMVDIAVTLVIPVLDHDGRGPRFEDPEITRDVQDADGAHLGTLVWDDPEGRWLELGDPLAGLSVLDGGLV